MNLEWILPKYFFSSPPPSKSSETISCPTNAVYPLGCETSAVCSHWLLELFLLAHSGFFTEGLIKKLVAVQTRCENGRLLIMCLKDRAGVAYLFPAFTDDGHCL